MTGSCLSTRMSFSYSTTLRSTRVRGIIQNALISSQRAALHGGVVPAARAASARQPSPNLKRRDMVQSMGRHLWDRPRPAPSGRSNDVRSLGSKHGSALYCSYGVAGQDPPNHSVDPRPIQSVEMLVFPGTLKFAGKQRTISFHP